MSQLIRGKGDHKPKNLATTASLLASQANTLVPQELSQFCPKLPQIVYLHQIRQSYHQLVYALQEYFAGQEISTSELSKQEANRLLLEVDRWTSLYDVLSAGLPYIKQAKYRVNGKPWQMPPDITPGEILVHLLKGSALAEFYKCQLPFHRESSPEIKRHLQTIQDVLNGIDFPDLSKRLAALRVAGRQVEHDFEWLIGSHYSLIEVCQRAAKKDRRLREKLDTHDRVKARQRETLIRQAYTQPSLQWNKGIPKFGVKSGGSYA